MLYELERYHIFVAEGGRAAALAGSDKVHVEHIYAQKPEKKWADH